MNKPPRKIGVSRIGKLFRQRHWPRDRRIDFLVCGVQKGGTTALDNWLRSHPDIGMPERKELHFFDNEKLVRLPERIRYRYYHSFFDGCDPKKVLGEVTPAYIWWENALERIRHYRPDIKLIVIFRDPVSRAFSHWNMERRDGRESRPFGEAIRATYGPGTKTRQHRVFSYVERGFYAQQLERLRSMFPGERIHCLRQDALWEDPKRALGGLADFLEVGPFPDRAAAHARAGYYEARVERDDEQYLLGVYRPDTERLEALLGWDLSAWKALGRCG